MSAYLDVFNLIKHLWVEFLDFEKEFCHQRYQEMKNRYHETKMKSLKLMLNHTGHRRQ